LASLNKLNLSFNYKRKNDKSRLSQIKFLNQLEQEVSPELDVHLIIDNYSIHKSPPVQRWLKPKKRRRFHFHFTPTGSSWLNQVERWFAEITNKRIRRGTFDSVGALEKAIYDYLAAWNQEAFS